MRADRLLKLAEHLETGKLYHEKFDFGILSERDLDPNQAPYCGSVGCAMGELPHLFPELCFHDGYGLGLVGGPNEMGQTYRCVQTIFDISRHAVRWLFEPCAVWEIEVYGTEYGFNRLPDTATKDEVAANIRQFIKHTEGAHAD